MSTDTPSPIDSRLKQQATVALILVGAGIAALGVIAVVDLFLMLNGG